MTATQVVARFPLGMLSLALLVHVHAMTGSYAAAGVAVAAWSIGEGVAGPLAGRLLGRYGVVRTVGASATLCAVIVSVLASGLTGWVPVLLCLVGGMTVPPVAQAARSVYPTLVPTVLLPALFAVDASAQEVIWAFGPLLATTLAGVSTAAPLTVAAVVLWLGSAWFLALRVVRRGHAADSAPARTFGRSLTNPTVLVAVLTSAMLVASYSALEVAVLDRFGSDTARTGIAIAVSSVGSLVGGLTFGPRVRGTRGLILSMTAVCVFTAAAAVAPGQPLFLAAMFLSGLGFAPASGYLSMVVSTNVAPGEAGEAFGWVGTGALVGAAAGTAVGGLAIDASGGGAAFLVAVVAGALGASVPPASVALRSRGLQQPRRGG